MALISENVALIVIGVILVLSVLIAWYFSTYSNYEKGWVHIFMSVLAGLGVFVVFLFYYNVVALQNQQQQLAIIDELARLNDEVINTQLEQIKQASLIIPNFVMSIMPLSNCCNSCQIGPDPETPPACTMKMALSYTIFSVWQDVIISNKLIGFDSKAYVSNFLQRANSTQLYDQWLLSSLDFNNDTQIFGNLLFEYGLPITVQTPAEYVKVADQLIADPRYQQLFPS